MVEDSRAQRHVAQVEWVEVDRSYPCLNLIGSADTSNALEIEGPRLVGLIDTGADHCVCAPTLFRPGELEFSRSGLVHTADGIVGTEYYNMSIVLQGIPVVVPTECSIGKANTFFGPFNFVIGRDVLSLGTLILERTSGGTFSMDLLDIQPRS